jgi:MFS family permease
VIGFSFSQVGLMYSISLLPFIVLEIPVGRIADKLTGEKEPLILGFVIMSLSIVIISLLQTNNFVVWTFLLLLTRVGASLIEITTESYFFKHVNKSDSNLMSIFRMISPAAHIFTAITASILLWKVPYNYVFFIFGIMILVVGLRHTIPLSESRK